MSGHSDSGYSGCSFFPIPSLFSYFCVAENQGLNEKEKNLESSFSSEGVNSYEELPISRTITIAEGVPDTLEALGIGELWLDRLASFSSDGFNKPAQSTDKKRLYLQSSFKEPPPIERDEFPGFEEQPSEQPKSKSNKQENSTRYSWLPTDSMGLQDHEEVKQPPKQESPKAAPNNVGFPSEASAADTYSIEEMPERGQVTYPKKSFTEKWETSRSLEKGGKFQK